MRVRVAFGSTNFANYRIRTLLYVGKPNWALLDTLTPTQNAKSHLSSTCSDSDRPRRQTSAESLRPRALPA